MFCTVSMAACEILFVIADSRLWVILTGVLFTTASGTYIHMFNIYVAEMLPTRVRALGVSSGWAINRLTSVMVPLVLLPLLVSKGAIWMCGAQAGSLMVSALLLAIAPRGQAGRPVADRPTGKLSL
jgi:putative MFS transporter